MVFLRCEWRRLLILMLRVVFVMVGLCVGVSLVVWCKRMCEILWYVIKRCN